MPGVWTRHLKPRRGRKRNVRYYVIYRDEHGKKCRKPSSARTKEEALQDAFERERHAQRRRDGLEPGSPVPTKLRKYVEESYRPGWLRRIPGSSATVESQLDRHILPALGELLLTELSPTRINAFLVSKLGELSGRSVNYLRSTLQKILGLAVKDGLLLRNPVIKDNVPPLDHAKRAPVALTTDEVSRAIVHAPAGWKRNLLATAFFTGLRKMELFRLAVRDINLESRLVTVRTAKNKRPRRVPIPDALMPFLEDQMADCASEWLFPNSKGGQRTKNYKTERLMRRCLVLAGIIVGFDVKCRGCGFVERRKTEDRTPCPKCGFKLWPVPVPPADVRFHDTRSTFATHAYAATGDIRFVSEVIGHESGPNFTMQHYSLSMDSHRLAQANKLTYREGLPVGHTQVTSSTLSIQPELLAALNSLVASGLALRARQESNLRPSDSKSEGRGVLARTHRLPVAAKSTAYPAPDVASFAIVSQGLPPGGHTRVTLGPEWMTRDEVAALLEVEPVSVYKLRDEGAFGSVKVGRSVFFVRSEVEAYRSARGKPRGRGRSV